MNTEKQNSLLWHYILVILLTLTLRLLLIGGPPTTDEGIYAFNAFFIHLNQESNSLIPNKGLLSLYAIATSWIFNLDLNHLILLRLVDAIIASIAGLLLYITIKNECEDKKSGLLISLAFIYVMNDPVFIQYGYKNSIVFASVPLLCAIIIGQNYQMFSPKHTFLAGCLVAFAVLVREPFVVFAILGFFASYIRWGFRGGIYYVLGGLLTGFSIILFVCLLRQDNSLEILKSYIDMHSLYGDMAFGKQRRSMHSLDVYFKHTYGIFIVISLFLLALVYSKQRSSFKRYAFWISLSLVPLVEPMLKNGFPYHFAVTLLGLSGLFALLVKDTLPVVNQLRFKKIAILTTTCIFIITVLPLTFAYANNYYLYIQNSVNPSLNNWSENIRQQSNVLIIVDYLKKNARNKETLSVNGNLLGLIPLAQLPPPNYDLSNLNYALVLNGKSEKFLYNKLSQCPADWVVLTSFGGGNLNRIIKETVTSIPQYKKMIFIPPKPSNHYGFVDAEIYHWEAPKQPCLGEL